MLLTIGEGIIYASVALSGEPGAESLKKAVAALLASVEGDTRPAILWSVAYEQQPSSGVEVLPTGEHVLRFPATPLDLAFDDAVLENVQDIWRKIMGDDAGEFLVFPEREAYADDEE